MTEPVTATEKAETKINGLMMGCMISQTLMMYDATIMNASIEV
jgi:hypothetical protein